jgi:hypothetical protein
MNNCRMSVNEDDPVLSSDCGAIPRLRLIAVLFPKKSILALLQDASPGSGRPLGVRNLDHIFYHNIMNNCRMSANEDDPVSSSDCSAIPRLRLIVVLFPKKSILALLLPVGFTIWRFSMLCIDIRTRRLH